MVKTSNTLSGHARNHSKKAAAERIAKRVKGVVKPRVNAADVKEKIDAALRRNAEIDARKISVDINDGSVTLRGTVRSFVEREDAVSAAWAAPGVRKVIDELTVRAA